MPTDLVIHAPKNPNEISEELATPGAAGDANLAACGWGRVEGGFSLSTLRPVPFEFCILSYQERYYLF